MGPILGGILAAGLYEYLYCPDPEIKKRMKQVFKKDPTGKYREVEAGDIAVKPGSIHNINVEKADVMLTGEVWLSRALEMETNL